MPEHITDYLETTTGTPSGMDLEMVEGQVELVLQVMQFFGRAGRVLT